MRLIVVEHTQLVRAIHLPRQPQVRAAVHDARVRLAAEVRRVGPRRRRRIVVEARDVVDRTPVAISVVEPQFVFLDRAAPRGIDVPQLLQRVHGRQPLRAQFVRQVVRLRSVAAVAQKEESGELVAPFLRDQVGPDPGHLLLGRLTRHLDAHFLHAALIDVVDEATATWAGEAMVFEPVDGHVRFA